MQGKHFFALVFLAIVTIFSMPVEVMSQVAAGGQGSKQESKAYAVRGQVFDDDGEPLMGVSVRDPKSKRGCLTDADGKFSLVVDGPAVIVMSYVGKKPVEMKMTPGKSVKVVMHNNENEMQEVVVTGIYNRNKESFTGSSKTFD
ncbi:MAG: carboxypeptidase-like regulatory domain-containing protein, partial [Muribaculaceae bacterium]|nr:carboxypeptidase-like regulatory domain-containing protein [Muribaculaceae bacterium]